MRYAVVHGDAVLNVVVAPEGYGLPPGLYPEGAMLVPSDAAGPGWRYVGGEFVPPPPPPPEPEPVPEIIDGWKAEVVMRVTPLDPDDPEGPTIWDAVQSAIAAMPDPVQRITAQTVLARGRLARNSPMLRQLADALGITQERIDDLFRAADRIEA